MHGDRALVAYRIRTVQIGFQTTILILLVLGPLVVVQGGTDIPILPFLALCATAAVGAVVTLKLPWERLYIEGTALRWLYAWSIADIAVITTFLAIAGPDKPNFFFLYMFTTIFFAASYPLRGQVLLFALTVTSYLGVWLVFSEGEPFSRAAFRIAALGIVAFMASFLSRELMQQIAANDEARAELQREKTLHDSLLQAQSDLGESACIVDLTTQRFTFVNDAMCRMYGYTKEEMLALPSFMVLFAPEEQQRLAPRVEARLRGVRTTDYDQVTVIRKDGARLHVEAAYKPLDDIHLIVLSRDVTDRWEAAAEMERSVSLLQATLESTTDGILVANANGEMVAYNEKFVRMWRLPPDIMAAQDDERAIAVVLEQLEDPDAFVSKIHALYESDEESFDILEFKDGRTFERYSQPQRIGGSDGQIVGRVWSFRDISARRAAERTLQEQHAALTKTDREKRKLLTHLVRAKEEERKRVASDIHDDSIQVMTSVAIGLERLANDTEDPQLRGTIERLEDLARSSVARLRKMVFELRPPTLDEEGLDSALRLYLEEFHVETDIAYTFSNELQAEPAVSDRTVLYRIAQEALTNVRKHAKAGHVAVALAESDGGISLRIEDDGVGLTLHKDDEAILHIGLPEMKERAEILGGRLDVRSRPRRGTVVEAWIPAPDEPEASATPRFRVV